MALSCISSSSSLCSHRAQAHLKLLCLHQHPSTVSGLSYSSLRSTSTIVRARRASSRTGKLENRTKKGGGLTTRQDPDQEEQQQQQLEDLVEEVDDGYVLPDLPGAEKDFWEGPQWDAFGFFVQYQWAFGIGFALIACGIAVATYNEGATDFKQTPAYKESIQSRELLEEPDASSSDVFEGNPTEEAPSLD
ncbi:hypothetical protein CKAN_00516800 [Cinnamomum micranthum f. kanehirae]|uniref:Uncharacterized protein n=1 Tax=Cinnamomum micranthum f. kanehirae TaxID=337451 RepID=A0A3S4NFY6_9MAGN|nr:hypothetical protein CKAN_00516800 [Cinnamomum micranthum f. kanehirae]